MNTLITQRAAIHVLRAGNLGPGVYTASELNSILDRWPKPRQALDMMGSSISNCDILYQDCSMEDVGYNLYSFIVHGVRKFPIFLMPSKLSDIWHQDEHAKVIRSTLMRHGMDVTVNPDGQSLWVKGDWCFLCDMRIRFDFTGKVEPTPAALELDFDNAIRLLGLPTQA